MNPHKIQLDVHEDARGRLVVLDEIPFVVKRSFHIFFPIGHTRGQHSCSAQQILMCLMGEMSVNIEHNGKAEKFHLRMNAHRAVYIPSDAWVTFRSLSRSSLCLVLASTTYEETEYVRDYDEFQQDRSAVYSV